MTDRRIELLREGYEAINRGEPEPQLATLDPDAVCVEPEGFAAPGTYLGRDGFADYLRKNRDFWATAHTEPEEFVTVGARIVALVRHRGRRRSDGREVDVRFADVFTFRDEMIMRIEAFTDRREALAAARGARSAQPTT
jgi:ketosteroid isomerase-like protein